LFLTSVLLVKQERLTTLNCLPAIHPSIHSPTLFVISHPSCVNASWFRQKCSLPTWSWGPAVEVSQVTAESRGHSHCAGAQGASGGEGLINPHGSMRKLGKAFPKLLGGGGMRHLPEEWDSREPASSAFWETLSVWYHFLPWR
jgi:hypothetical protein